MKATSGRSTLPRDRSIAPSIAMASEVGQAWRLQAALVTERKRGEDGCCCQKQARRADRDWCRQLRGRTEPVMLTVTHLLQGMGPWQSVCCDTTTCLGKIELLKG